MTVSRYLPAQPSPDDFDPDSSRDSDTITATAKDLDATTAPAAKHALGLPTEPPMTSEAVAFASPTREKPFVAYPQDENSETVVKYDGASWVLTRKDLHSGLIMRFTQTGSGSVGTVEIMQGKSVAAGWVPNAISHPHGARNPDPSAWYNWQGIEDKGVVLKTLKSQPLPKEMRENFATMNIAAPWLDPRTYDGIYPDPARTEVIQERRDLAARLNAEQAAHKPNLTGGRRSEHHHQPDALAPH